MNLRRVWPIRPPPPVIDHFRFEARKTKGGREGGRERGGKRKIEGGGGEVAPPHCLGFRF